MATKICCKNIKFRFCTIEEVTIVLDDFDDDDEADDDEDDDEADEADDDEADEADDDEDDDEADEADDDEADEADDDEDDDEDMDYNSLVKELSGILDLPKQIKTACLLKNQYAMLSIAEKQKWFESIWADVDHIYSVISEYGGKFATATRYIQHNSGAPCVYCMFDTLVYQVRYVGLSTSGLKGRGWSYNQGVMDWRTSTEKNGGLIIRIPIYQPIGKGYPENGRKYMETMESMFTTAFYLYNQEHWFESSLNLNGHYVPLFNDVVKRKILCIPKQEQAVIPLQTVTSS